MWRIGSTTLKNAAYQREPLLALCFGIARVRDHSLRFFTLCRYISCSTQLLREFHVAGVCSKSQAYARRGPCVDDRITSVLCTRLCRIPT